MVLTFSFGLTAIPQCLDNIYYDILPLRSMPGKSYFISSNRRTLPAVRLNWRNCGYLLEQASEITRILIAHHIGDFGYGEVTLLQQLFGMLDSQALQVLKGEVLVANLNRRFRDRTLSLNLFARPLMSTSDLVVLVQPLLHFYYLPHRDGYAVGLHSGVGTHRNVSVHG